MKKSLYLIDGYSLIYRAYFAFLRNPRMNSKGENTSAVFGFFRTLMNLIKRNNPSHLAVVMDSTVPTFRHEQYPEYKAGREKTPPDLHAQIPRIEKILEALGITVIRKDRYEADDIIAHIAAWCKSTDLNCYIFSKDKDLFQLVDDTTFILYPGKQDFEQWGRDEVYANKGVWPEQIIDYLSLMGDASDNIPGVLGIGEKTASKLLAEFKTLDNLYENINTIKSKSQKKKLEEGKEKAYFSKELVRLDHKVPVEPSLEMLAVKEADNARALELLHEDGVKNLDKDLGASDTAAAEEASAIPEGKKGTYTLMTSLDELAKWIKLARKKKIFAFDIETDNIDDMIAEPIGFAFTYEAEKGYYLPIKAMGVDCPPADEVKKLLKPFLEQEDLKLVGQNFKYDYKVLKRWGIHVKCLWFDTMIAAWVLDSSAGAFNMDKLAEVHLNYKTVHYTDLIPKKEKITLADIESHKVVDYAGEDADITFRLYETFAPRLEKEERLNELFFNVEMPLVTILADMEIEGIKILPDRLTEYGRELEKKLVFIEDKVFKLCGKTFNIRSTKELQVVLFEDRKLKPVKKTKTGYSTDAQVLEILAEEDEVAELVLQHRMLAKLKSTYVDTLPKLVNPRTGRIHTSLMQTGTATGRLSSNNPNLQNIPVKEEEGRRIRESFVPREGHQFLSADYSQIELVILAHLAEEENLIEAFKNNKDIHRHTAAVLFDLKDEDVMTSQRRVGKTINFAVIYGMTAFRLSRDLKISRKEADLFIKTYFELYAGVNRYKEETIKMAETNGYVETILGRRRYLPNITNKNKTVKMAEERIALNTPIQGSAADIVKLAMLKTAEELKKKNLKSRLILQVHDELILEVPEDEVKAVETLTRSVMESIIELKAPLKVNIEVKESWDKIH